VDAAAHRLGHAANPQGGQCHHRQDRYAAAAIAAISVVWRNLCPNNGHHLALRRVAIAAEIVMDDVIRLTDVEVHKQRIHGVAQAKKREEAKIYKESGQVVMRQERQLFAYKFYIDQEPLDVPTERLNEVHHRAFER